MGLYSKYILPKLIDWACRQKPSAKQREKVIPLATGKVLEIGAGSGLNLPFYEKQNIRHLTVVEPALEVWQRNKVDTSTLGFEFTFVQAFAEELPLESNAFDTVVITYSLCTIKNTDRALDEVKRVLKPGGKLLFNEHGKAPDASVFQWQNRLDPIWQQFSGGCSLHKNIPELIKARGFIIHTLESMYVPGWKPASYNYWGVATVQ